MVWFLRQSLVLQINSLLKRTFKFGYVKSIHTTEHEVGVFWRGGSLRAQISYGKESRTPTTVGVRKLQWLIYCPFVWYQNIRSALFGFVTKHACVRRTDEQNFDSQDRVSVWVRRAVMKHVWHTEKVLQDTIDRSSATAISGFAVVLQLARISGLWLVFGVWRQMCVYRHSIETQNRPAIRKI